MMTLRLASRALLFAVSISFALAAVLSGCSSGTAGIDNAEVGGTTTIETCPAAQTECGSSCVELQTDRANCGECGKTCPQEEVCSEGSCNLECVGGASKCGDLCIDLQLDIANCGACENACPDGEVCSAGKCALACTGGTTKCDGLCADLQLDAANCGSCGNACASGEVCSAGQCGLQCAGGTTKCGTICTNTDHDPSHCGMCDEACPGFANASAACGKGQCGSICNEGYGDCDSEESNGCETDITTDAAHCSACNAACAPGANALATCDQSQCALKCTVGFGNCNNDDTDGCEADFSSDEAHCSGCNMPCMQNEMCVNAVCVPGGFVPNFSGEIGPTFGGWKQCEGYLDKSGGDDVPQAWGDDCTNVAYTKIKLVCGATVNTYRYIDVNKNVFKDGLTGYLEENLILLAKDQNGNNFAIDNKIYANGSHPHTSVSWWNGGDGCNELATNITINNGCPMEAQNCFGQNIGNGNNRYLWIYVQ